jgi:alginate biosynthesis protein AlgK
MSMQAGRAITLLAAGFLAGCSVMDVDLARQQLAQGQTQQGEAMLTEMATQGYQEARFASAEWQAKQGDPDGLLQVKAWLQQEMERSGSSLAEWRYLQWLVPASVSMPQWTGEAEQRLAVRQQKLGDAFALQARLYALHGDQLNAETLRPAFDALDLTDPMKADLWLQAQLRLHVLQLPLQGARLQLACDRAGSQGEPLQHCLAGKLAALRNGGSQTLADWQQQVQQAYEAGHLAAPSIGVLMDSLVSSKPNGPQIPAAIELGTLAMTDADVALRVYDLQLGLPGDEAETQAMEQRLQQLAHDGHLLAYSQLGRLYLNSPRRVIDIPKAKAYLEQGASTPEGAYWLAQIYLSGQLGEATPDHVQRGVALMVSAARGGHRKADAYLAELFGEGEGVIRNPVYAYVFSELALARSDSNKLTRLKQSLALSPSQQAQADQLLRQELRSRDTGITVELAGPQTSSDTVRRDEEQG